ncbi:MAG: hypothetical protein J6K20_05350 [Thermoguttaceae bacterium]|nr:hypothetical protein [Thermoguttaceae bacterium]
METKKWEERKGIASYFASILAFWTVAFALGGILELDGGGPFGLIVAGVLGALLFGGPFFFVEICASSPSSERFWANASRVFGAGFVGALAAVAGPYWAAPLFFVVWFAIKRKTTALGPTLRRFPGRILAALVATAALCGATGAIFGNVDPSAGPPNGYFALLTALAVFYATAALAFALVAFKAANVDAETTCENVDDGVANVAVETVEAREPRKIGLVAYFAGVWAFAAFALWGREAFDDGFWFYLALLWNFPFFCATFGDRSLWRDWPLSFAVSSASAVLAICCCFLTPPLAGLIAAIPFGVWLAAIAKTAFWRWRTAAAVGILALVETEALFRAAATEEHFFCSLTVGLGIIPLIAFHWCALGAVVLCPKRRRDDAGKNEPRDWGEFYRRISEDNVGGNAETLGAEASE